MPYNTCSINKTIEFSITSYISRIFPRPELAFPKHRCKKLPVPVAARSKAYVCGRSPAEIIGSNPTGDMDVCLL